MRSTLLVVALAAPLAACNPPNGELGEGNFRYTCAGSTDAYCEGDDFFPSDDPPSQVATSSRFLVSFDRGIALSSSDLLVSEGSQGFRAVSPGPASIIGEADGRWVDYINIPIRNIDHLAVSRETSSGNVSVMDEAVRLEVGETTSLMARPEASDLSLLFGALATEWVSSNPEIVSVSNGTDNVVVLGGESEGQVLITVTMGDATAVVTVDVGAGGQGGGGGEGGIGTGGEGGMGGTGGVGGIGGAGGGQ